MRRNFYLFVTLLLLVSLSSVALAQEKQLTLDDIYEPGKKIDFSGSPTARLRWLKDGNHYLQVKRDAEARTSRLMKVNALTGKAEPFYDAAKMESAFASLPGFSREDARKLANRGSYQMNEAQSAALINYANDLFYYEFGADKAIRLTNNSDEEVGEEFSPDGRMISYIRNYNIYVVDIAGQHERALTRDGGPKLFYGRLDWVYQEELYGRGNFKGYWWSPDSTRIAFLKLDESPVHEFTVIDHIPHLQEVENTAYPQAGDPNPEVQLGVIKAAGGDIQWVDTFNYEGGDILIVRVGWTPDSQSVVYQIQDREQTWLDLNYANPDSGQSKNVLKERSKTWFEVIDEPYWLKDGSFLWLSDRDGWQHIYHYSHDGKLIKQVTEGKWEARSLEGVDEAGGWIYFNGTEHSPIENNAYRIKLDGTQLTRLTEKEGNHQVSFNPNASLYIDTWSDVTTPPQVRLFKANGEFARAIDENKVEVLNQYKLSKPEFLHVNTRDGFQMEAMMIKPPDFDPSKKYPVMSFTYSGPHAPQVRNAWMGTGYMYFQLLAQKGYIVWVLDNRTASGKGSQSTWLVFHNFGELELKDLLDGVSYLKSLPYVDGSRIGLTGWSFGGFMTTYALTHSDAFRIGIAGGSVTDWRLYDSIYTERYMGTPQNNPEGYEKSAPLNAAKNLHGKLLLIHGAMDDNVHMQNTIQFVYELQKAGKQFDLMLYPKSRHGVSDPLLVKHMRAMMTEFILKNL